MMFSSTCQTTTPEAGNDASKFLTLRMQADPSLLVSMILLSRLSEKAGSMVIPIPVAVSYLKIEGSCDRLRCLFSEQIILVVVERYQGN